MAVSLGIWERRARHVMGAVAVAGGLVLAAFKLGWISTQPSYKDDAWYLVGGNASFMVTSEFADEAACRRNESASSVCRPGKVLMEDLRLPTATHS